VIDSVGVAVHTNARVYRHRTPGARFRHHHHHHPRNHAANTDVSECMLCAFCGGGNCTINCWKSADIVADFVAEVKHAFGAAVVYLTVDRNINHSLLT